MVFQGIRTNIAKKPYIFVIFQGVRTLQRANNKVADQPVQVRRLVCAFVVRMQQNVSEYDQEIQQSHTADQPTAPRGGATEHFQKQNSERQLKQSNQLSLPRQYDCKPG